MTARVEAHQIAVRLVSSEIQDAEAELAEHARHLEVCQQRLAFLLSIQEALQASTSPEQSQ